MRCSGYILGMNIILQAEVTLTPNDPIEAMLITEGTVEYARV